MYVRVFLLGRASIDRCMELFIRHGIPSLYVCGEVLFLIS